MPSTILVPLSTLSDMLASVSLACHKDDYLPTLSAVYIEWQRDKGAGLLLMTATDRYQLLHAEVWIPEPAEKSPVAFLLDKKDAAALLKALPKPSRNFNEFEVVTVTSEKGKTTFEYGQFSMSYATLDGEFPKYRQLMSKEKEAAAPEIAFNVKLLATLAKVKTATTWRFGFTGSHKAAFAYSTETGEKDVKYTYMIMPVRLTM